MCEKRMVFYEAKNNEVASVVNSDVGRGHVVVLCSMLAAMRYKHLAIITVIAFSHQKSESASVFSVFFFFFLFVPLSYFVSLPFAIVSPAILHRTPFYNRPL